jgi:hypothetical protein
VSQAKRVETKCDSYKKLKSNLAVVLIFILIKIGKIRFDNTSFQEIRGNTHTGTVNMNLQICKPMA